jgi:glycosyltransferase involved in cell wall biosynthesis
MSGERNTLLHLETGRHLYGGALQVFYLLRGLQRSGVDNVLVCTRGSAIAKAARELGCRVYEVSMGGDLDVLFTWRLRRIIARERPAFVHVHSRRGADLWGGIAARLAHVPAVLTRRVDNPEPRWLVAFKYRFYRKVIAISHGIETVLRRQGVPADKLLCVHSAVDVDKYRPCSDVDAKRKELGLPAGKLVAVVAQLIERKGHRYLLDAVPAIVAAVPEARFVFFGQGPLQSKLREHCVRLRVADRVTFAGFRDDLDKLLPCVDLVVHPADMEGLGVSLLQAAACAVPIVATAAGGIPEIVREGENGVLVEKGNVDALADAVIAVLRDDARARALGAAGRRLAENEFSIASMVRGNQRVYAALRAVAVMP